MAPSVIEVSPATRISTGPRLLSIIGPLALVLFITKALSFLVEDFVPEVVLPIVFCYAGVLKAINRKADQVRFSRPLGLDFSAAPFSGERFRDARNDHFFASGIAFTLRTDPCEIGVASRQNETVVLLM
ncbi:hypothetical protein [Rhodoplanes sp. SY1]|uniref:hypothetical protein n=1 Tax=Rhodoplanes sp. SY1 TaxID=3166646 RepID=UPI0038B5DA48